MQFNKINAATILQVPAGLLQHALILFYFMLVHFIYFILFYIILFYFIAAFVLLQVWFLAIK